MIKCPVCSLIQLRYWTANAYICDNCGAQIPKDALEHKSVVTPAMRIQHFEKTGAYVSDEEIMKWVMDEVSP